MSSYASAWELSRQRLVDTVKDLNKDQLNWQIHPASLSIGRMTLHVAGVEISFMSQLCELELDEFGLRLKSAATEGVVNENKFPFSDEEITPELIERSLSIAKDMTEPLMSLSVAELPTRQIKSALGPMINAEAALARLSFHPAYHQGQAYLIRTAPSFPA